MNNNSFSLFLNHHENGKSFVSEELEAEEDELRRNEEIKEMMQNAFEDLDDSGSISSNSYLASLSGCCNSKNSYSEFSSWGYKQNNVAVPQINHYSDYNNKAPESTLISKIDNLQKELEETKEKDYEQKEKLLNRLNSLEKEKEDILNQHNQIHKLFDNAQFQLLKKEKELQDCQQKLQDIEKIKNDTLQQLELSQFTIEELQDKLSQQERKHFQYNGEVDNLMKELSSQEEQKISSYQKEFANLNDKLILKEKKCNELEQQLLELHQLHKSLIAEKSETINKLISNLEICQSRCQKLMTSNLSRLSDSEINAKGDTEKSRQSLPTRFGENSKLIEELSRTYADLKQKNAENKFLQEQVKTCAKEIKKMKELENQYLNNLSSLKEENVNLKRQLHLKQPTQSKIELFESFILQIEEKMKALEDENIALKKEKENAVDLLEVENPEFNGSCDKPHKFNELNKKLENSLRESDTLKQMYLDISSSKEKLLLQNKQLQTDINKLHSENAALNKIIKTFNHDKNELLHYGSLGQDSIYLKYCPRSDSISNKGSCASDNQENEVEILKDQLKIYEEKYNQDLGLLGNEIQKYIAEIEAHHNAEINQLKEQHFKQFKELEVKHNQHFNQFEVQFKEAVLKISSEEIQNLSNRFQNNLDVISETAKQLQNELETKNQLVEVLKKQLEDANVQIKKYREDAENTVKSFNESEKEWKKKISSLSDKQNKLHIELEIIYNKYKSARKAAVESKQMLDEQIQILHQQQKFFVRTLNDIQNYLNEKLECETKDNWVPKINNHENLIIPGEEISIALRTIKKQLENLNYRK